MTAVEMITAALDEAEKRLALTNMGPLNADANAVRSVGGFAIALTNSDVAGRSRLYADLIVSVVNRERRQVQHARDVLALAGYLRQRLEVRAAVEIERSLLAVWCPEPTP